MDAPPFVSSYIRELWRSYCRIVENRNREHASSMCLSINSRKSREEALLEKSRYEIDQRGYSCWLWLLVLFDCNKMSGKSDIKIR